MRKLSFISFALAMFSSNIILATPAVMAPQSLQVACRPSQGLFPRSLYLQLKVETNKLETSLVTFPNGSISENNNHNGVTASYAFSNGTIGNIVDTVKVGFTKRNRQVVVDLTSTDGGKIYSGIIIAAKGTLGNGIIEEFATGGKVKIDCSAR